MIYVNMLNNKHLEIHRKCTCYLISSDSDECLVNAKHQQAYEESQINGDSLVCIQMKSVSIIRMLFWEGGQMYLLFKVIAGRRLGSFVPHRYTDGGGKSTSGERGIRAKATNHQYERGFFFSPQTRLESLPRENLDTPQNYGYHYKKVKGGKIHTLGGETYFDKALNK